jgi:hypothetical protein
MRDNPRNYMGIGPTGPAPKGPGFAERVPVGQREGVKIPKGQDVDLPKPIRGDAPMTRDPHPDPKRST